jgi:fructan beta-fructosidase
MLQSFVEKDNRWLYCQETEPRPLRGLSGRNFWKILHSVDLTADLTPGSANEVGFNLRGVKVSYDVKKQELSCVDKRAALKAVAGRIRLRLMVDRGSVHIFGNDGRLYMPIGAIVPQDILSLEVYAKGGDARINSLEVHELKSACATQPR